MMSEKHEKSYWCQEIPVAVTGVRLTFEDWKFIVDWSGSGEVAPDEGCVVLASPEAKYYGQRCFQGHSFNSQIWQTSLMNIGLQHCTVLKNAACFLNQDSRMSSPNQVLAVATAVTT